MGGQNEQEFRITEVNTDFLLTVDRELTSFDWLTGNCRWQHPLPGTRDTHTQRRGWFLNVPGLEVVTNQNTRSHGYGFNEKQINSLYGSAELAYNDYLFLTLTARNDWSSTLPVDNNSYFYPSISGSFVFSDALEVPEWLSFGKIRASWAEVGGDTNPYALALTYGLSGSHLGQPRGQIAQGNHSTGRPEALEYRGKLRGAFDIRFLDNRFGLDFTYYTQSATDQILFHDNFERFGFSVAK